MVFIQFYCFQFLPLIYWFFNPVARRKAQKIELDLPRIDYWTGTGAKMSDRVRTLVMAFRKQAAA